MTEAEWLASTDVQAMYVFLRDTMTLFKTRWQGYRSVPQFAASERKLRLFAVACCRRIVHLVPVEATRAVVDMAEGYADGSAGEEELRAAVDLSERACRPILPTLASHGSYSGLYEREAIDAVNWGLRPDAIGRAGVIWRAATAWGRAAAGHHAVGADDYPSALIAAEHTHQAVLLRDIVGNPFQASAIDPSWLAWNDRCVERMARGIYDERAFHLMPILHDALLDAGCDDEHILAHCRTPEGHVRGCWVIDLLLARE